MFLGDSPDWYKNTIIAFLVINPITLLILNSMDLNGNFIVGWMILLEFIFTLALALKCYPLQPGGLIAIQTLFLGCLLYTSPSPRDKHRSRMPSSA